MSRRTRQVASAIQVELANLVRRELNDPRITAVGMITISEVQVAPDHRNGTAYVSFMGKEEKSQEVQDALAALRNSANFIHRSLVKRLSWKVVPHLHFRYDRSFDHAQKVAIAMSEGGSEDLGGDSSKDE